MERVFKCRPVHGYDFKPGARGIGDGERWAEEGRLIKKTPRTGGGIGMVVSWLYLAGDMFQHVNQQLPETLDRRDVYLLPRCVSATDGRAEGDHVPVRVGAL